MHTIIHDNKRSLVSMAFALLIFFSGYICIRVHHLMANTAVFASVQNAWLVAITGASVLLFLALKTRGVLLGYLIYLGGIYATADIVLLLLRVIAQQSLLSKTLNGIYLSGATPIVLAWWPSIYGRYNAKRIRVVQYTVSSPRFRRAGNPLRVVMLSDMHLGAGVQAEDVANIVEQANAQAPDLILLCGDIFEEQTTKAQYEAALAAFKDFSALYGIYYVPGNHEYVAYRHNEAHLKTLKSDLAGAGVRMLCDETVLVGDAFYLVGRDDKAHRTRREFADLVSDVRSDLPVIMMGHRPLELQEAKRAGVDVQFSGHTHAGQLFNFGKLGERLSKSEMLYGLRRSGAYHAIVSSGVGTWVFPMRLGSPSEIVVADIS